MRGKQSPATISVSKVDDAPELHALAQAAAALLACRPVPFRTASALVVSSPDLWGLARALPPRLSASSSSLCLLLGWYKHGGLTGVTHATSQIMPVVALLNQLLADAHPEGAWTTLALFSSAVAEPHTDRRNVKGSFNFILPLALPASEQYIWVSQPPFPQTSLQPLAWMGKQGTVQPGFRIPLVVGQPVCIDPHSPHALPSPLPQDLQAPHVLLVGYSAPWLHRATPDQLSTLQQAGFRLNVSRGGAGPGGIGLGGDSFSPRKQVGLPPGTRPEIAADKVCSSSISTLPLRDSSLEGLLDACMFAEGVERRGSSSGLEVREEQNPQEEQGTLEDDVQPDIFAEGSAGLRGAYARRLEARVFEPADWNRVKRYLEGLGLDHLIQAVDDMGVDSLEDFGFIYREDLMEAGATKEEAEAILNCTQAELEGRPEGPAQARAGLYRPSRPIAPQRPAVAVRLVNAPDRARRAAQGVPGQEGAIAFGAAQGVPGQEGAIARGAARGVPGQEGAIARGAAQGVPGQEGAIARGAARGVPGQEGDIAVGAARGVPGQEGAIARGAARGVPGQEGAVVRGAAQGVPGQEGAIARGAAQGVPGQEGAIAVGAARGVPGQEGPGMRPPQDPCLKTLPSQTQSEPHFAACLWSCFLVRQ